MNHYMKYIEEESIKRKIYNLYMPRHQMKILRYFFLLFSIRIIRVNELNLLNCYY